MGLLLSPIIYKCLLKVLCPVSRPMTFLDCVLLKDNNRALVVRSGPENSSVACLCTAGTTPQYQVLVFHPAFYLSSYILPRDPQERLRSNKPVNRTVSCELVGERQRFRQRLNMKMSLMFSKTNKSSGIKITGTKWPNVRPRFGIPIP